MQTRGIRYGTDGEDFKFKSSDEEPDQRKDIDDEKLVLTLQDYIESGTKEPMEMGEYEKTEHIRKELDPKLSHLPDEIQRTITELFVVVVTTLSLRDLSPSSVTHYHQFMLTNENPVYHSARRMVPKHYDVVQRS